MNKLLLIFLILLLPVRAFSAETMGLAMAVPAQTAGGGHAAGRDAGMPGDCPMLAKAGAVGLGKGSLPDSGKGCKACQLCMEVADLAEVVPFLAPVALSLPVRAGPQGFRSVVLAAITEPPIPRTPQP